MKLQYFAGALALGMALVSSSQAQSPATKPVAAPACPKTLIGKAGSGGGYMPYLVDIDTPFRTALTAQMSEDERETILAAYRDCIDRALAQIEKEPKAILTGQDKMKSPDGKPEFSPLGIQIPRLKQIRALTYIAPLSVERQDWYEASEGMRASIEALGEIQVRYGKEAEAYLTTQAKALDRRFNRNNFLLSLATVATAVAVGAATPQGQTPDVTPIVKGFNQISQKQIKDAAAYQERVRKTRTTAFSKPQIGKWSDDGFRVTFPRFFVLKDTQGAPTDYYQPYGALADYFGFNQIVYIHMRLEDGRSGHCTGSLVGPKLVLTNRHCVTHDGKAIPAQNLNVLQESFGRDLDTSGLRAPSSIRQWAKVVKTEYPAADEETDWANDWALLVIDQKLWGWLDVVDPARIPENEELRIMVAGYSADLNDGSEITLDWGCRAMRKKNLIWDECRSWKGSSGSPVLVADDAYSRFAVLGVHARGSDKAGDGSVDIVNPLMYATWRKYRDEQRPFEK